MPRKSLQESLGLISFHSGHFPLLCPYVSKYKWLKPIYNRFWLVSFFLDGDEGCHQCLMLKLQSFSYFSAIFFLNYRFNLAWLSLGRNKFIYFQSSQFCIVLFLSLDNKDITQIHIYLFSFIPIYYQSYVSKSKHKFSPSLSLPPALLKLLLY